MLSGKPKIIEIGALSSKIEQVEVCGMLKIDDFLMISGSQMREYARNGETPPDGFMGEKAWQVVAEYYASIN